jgi:Concanavalin A-like lectin/glucanases superfamily
VVGTASWTAGKLSNCIQLNGTNRVEINSLLNGPKNVTLSGWANLTAADTGGAEIVSIGNHISLRLNESGTTKVFFYNGTSWVSVSTSQTFAGAGWHHFAGVFNDDQNFCKLYIDGVEVASTATAVTLNYTGLGTKTVIGAHGSGSTTTDFNGKLDDVQIYSRALCPLEIQALHSSGFGGVKITKWIEIQ